MKVSVAMITYNHEKFIAQAVESALMQETDFDYEIVIGEDCSSDGTGEILKAYQEKHPDKIRVLAREKSLGMHRNLVDVHQSCIGQYIALLEGDDYWTDPHKLQRQVDFLDSHPECSICFHSAKRVFEDGSQEPSILPSTSRKEFYTLEDLLEGNFIPTCSVMFRRGLFDKFPSWFDKMPQADWPLHILNAQRGNIGYINAVMGVYRVHGGGMWSTLDTAKQIEKRIESREMIRDYLGSNYHKALKASQYRSYYMLFRIYLKRGDLIKARMHAWKGIIGHCYYKNASPSTLIKMVLRVYAPALYQFIRASKRALSAKIM